MSGKVFIKNVDNFFNANVCSPIHNVRSHIIIVIITYFYNIYYLSSEMLCRTSMIPETALMTITEYWLSSPA